MNHIAEFLNEAGDPIFGGVSNFGGAEPFSPNPTANLVSV